MSVPYEKLVAEDLNLGIGTVQVTMPAGGTATGNKINPATFAALGAFSVSAPGTQVVTGIEDVELTNEAFDTHSWFNTGTFRYIPQKAGYYAFQACLTFTAAGQVSICKNGVAFMSARVTDEGTWTVSGLASANGSTDEFRLILDSGTGTITAARFSGHCVGGL